MTRYVYALAVIALLLGTPAAQAQTPKPISVFPPHIARMFGATTQDAWTAVQQVLKRAGIKTEILDEAGRFLVTRPVDVNRKRFGIEVREINERYQSGKVRLQVFVPPFVEPARVYVTSVLEARARNSGGKTGWYEYNPPALDSWLLDALSAKLAVPAEPVLFDAAQRAAAARRLLPAGASDRCLEPPNGRPDQPGVKIHDLKPMFPPVEQRNRRQDVVIIEMSLGEDGFAWPLRILRGAQPDEPFGIASLGAVSHWLFRPATLGGCPKPTTMTVTVSFTMQ